MANIDRYGRATFTASQINQFFDRISLPAHHRSHPALRDRSLSTKAAGLDLLVILQKYSLASIPFESLDLHYSSHHSIFLDPQLLFEKIVTRNAGRGGYCMENNTLFGTVLRSLGYDVYPTGARINEAIHARGSSKYFEGPRYVGWSHMVNIVTIEGQKYCVDVGFGSSGPSFPLLLQEISTAPNIGTQSLRLENLAPIDLLTHSSASQKLWEYSYRHHDESAWVIAYSFSEQEFLPEDFEIMSFYMSRSRKSWFTLMVICGKMLMDREENLVGDVGCVGKVFKKRVNGESHVLAECVTEVERVKALEEFLGVRLDEVDRRGIRGLISEIV